MTPIYCTVLLHFYSNSYIVLHLSQSLVIVSAHEQRGIRIEYISQEQSGLATPLRRIIRPSVVGRALPTGEASVVNRGVVPGQRRQAFRSWITICYCKCHPIFQRSSIFYVVLWSLHKPGLKILSCPTLGNSFAVSLPRITNQSCYSSSIYRHVIVFSHIRSEMLKCRESKRP